MDNISTIKDRLILFIESIGISKQLFFNEMGIAQSNFRGSNMKSSIGSDKVVKILTAYPSLSPEWLMLGEGEMLRDPSKQAANDPKKEIIPSHTPQEGIPLIPIEAWAGALSGEDYSIMEDECERYVVPSFQDADFLITVRGDSMTPKYYSGDIVACRKVFLSDLWFQWGKVYIIDTNQGSLLKKVRPGSSEDTITLVSENPEYEPFELRKDQIYNIAIVQGIIRAE